MARLRAAAALALSGRYAGPGRQAAGGLAAWARHSGAALDVEDAGSDPAETARRYRRLARRADLVFGPYGSGPTRAVADALAGDPAVVWNHGGAAAPPAGGRLVSVIGSAERYWAGLAAVLAEEDRDLGRVAVLRAPTGFGRAVASGAVASLDAAGHRPLSQEDFDAATAADAARRALAAGADAVVGCGRIEDDLALGRALAGAGVAVGLVVCGVALAAEALGDAVAGWIGPAPWWPGGPAPPVPLWPGADYPAAQALAAGLVAEAAVRAAGGTEPDALWRAARALRTWTFLGPFAIDAAGRQVAHAPAIVRWTLGRDGPVREPAWGPRPRRWQTPAP
jgi:ABC-type branched-subunit amino acid transport system substrate-binding protein